MITRKLATYYPVVAVTGPDRQERLRWVEPPIAGRLQTAGLPLRLDNVVVYGGETSQQRSTARLLGWRDVRKILHQNMQNEGHSRYVSKNEKWALSQILGRI